MKTITVTLTIPEAGGLFRMADEGAEGLLTDECAARAYIGTKAQQEAASRGLEKLTAALREAGYFQSRTARRESGV